MADAPGLGHNNPPGIPTPVEILQDLSVSQVVLLSRRDDLLTGERVFLDQHPSIEDDDAQGLASDVRKQIAAAIKRAEEAHRAAKAPFLRGGVAVDSFFKGITGPLRSASARVQTLMDAYAERIERQRRAALQAAARQAEAQAQAAQAALLSGDPTATIETAIVAAETAEQAAKRAAAPASALTRVRGDLGSVTSSREVWDVEVIDLSLVPLEYLLFDHNRARRAVAGGRLREISGCRVFSTRTTQTR